MQQVCRTCLEEITDVNYITLKDDVESFQIKSKLKQCIPEMVVDLVKKPTLCLVCVNTLQSAYDFRNRCLRTEKRIRSWMRNVNRQKGCIDLVAFFKANLHAPVGNFTVYSPDLDYSLESEGPCNMEQIQIKSEYDDTEVFQTTADEFTANEYHLPQAISQEGQKQGERYLKNIKCEDVNNGVVFSAVQDQPLEFFAEQENYSNDLIGDEMVQDCSVTPNRIPNNVMCPITQVDVKPDVSYNITDLEDVKSDTSRHTTSSEGIFNDSCDKQPSDDNTFATFRTSIHNGQKTFKCNVCEYSAKRKTRILSHMVVHRGERPFKCSVCKYSSKRKQTLVEHMRTHSGEKPFKCTICPFKATRKQNLATHVKTHGGKNSFICDICNYSAEQKRLLIKHISLHKGERKHKCNLCEFSCKWIGSLTEHMRIHSGEKPFICTVCGYKTIRKRRLEIHMTIHSGERPFKCNVCPYTSTEKKSLTKHMRIHDSV